MVHFRYFREGNLLAKLQRCLQKKKNNHTRNNSQVLQLDPINKDFPATLKGNEKFNEEECSKMQCSYTTRLHCELGMWTANGPAG